MSYRSPIRSATWSGTRGTNLRNILDLNGHTAPGTTRVCAPTLAQQRDAIQL